MKSRIACVAAFVTVLAVTTLVRTASACPSCSESIGASGSTGEAGSSGSMAGGIGGSMAAGYYWSILFMLVMLFSMVGVVVSLIWRQVRAEMRVPLPDAASSQ